MVRTEITLFLKNVPGELAKLTLMFSENNINRPGTHQMNNPNPGRILLARSARQISTSICTPVT